MKRASPPVVLAAALLAACESPTRPTAPSVPTEEAGVLAAAACPGPNTVAITDLGTLAEGEGRHSEGRAINKGGHVVGVSATAFLDHAAIWTPLDGWRDLGALPGSGHSVASDINDRGQVVGTIILDAAGGPRAFLWTRASGMRDLGAPRGERLSEAFAINSSGQVVGASQARPGGPKHAFRWTQAGGFQRLGALSGDRESEARDINTSGLSVGYRLTSAGNRRAVLWTPAGQMRDLGTLGGSYSQALAVNERGDVVGESTTRSGAAHAFLWSASGGMRDLGTLPTGGYSEAYGINDSGRVVGVSNTADNQFSNAVMLAAGQVRELGTQPGGDASQAFAINNYRQVVGWEAAVGRRPFHATMWTMLGTPPSEIRALGAQVQSLVPKRKLSSARARALVLKLEQAGRQVDAGQRVAAATTLRSFVADVQALIRAGNLGSSDGQPLINLANCTIGRLRS